MNLDRSCGFHYSVCLQTSVGFFRSVCPIHFNFLSFISDWINSCLLWSQRSALEFILGSQMRWIRRRYLLLKTCSLSVISKFVINHASQLYRRTDLTLELKSRNLIIEEIAEEFHTLLNCANAPRAFMALDWKISVSPPSVDITLPNWCRHFQYWCLSR